MTPDEEKFFSVGIFGLCLSKYIDGEVEELPELPSTIIPNQKRRIENIIKMKIEALELDGNFPEKKKTLQEMLQGLE